MTAVDVVTIGESLVLLQPLQEGPLASAALFTRSVAGAESNLALALARLGKRVRWVSRLGLDPFGDLVARTLAGEGVDTAFVVRDAAAPTAVFFREYRGEEPISHYYRAGSAASRLSANDLRPEWFDGARHLHVTGITAALGPAAAGLVAAAMREARRRGLTVSLDPNLRRKLWSESLARETLLTLVPLCDVFLPGLDEAEFLLGPRSPAALGPAFLELGPRLVALKLGARGAVGFAPGLALESPPFAVARVVDPIGAGDAFAAGFLSVLLDGPTWPGEAPSRLLAAALERANLLGALATQVRGDWEGSPSLIELERARLGLATVTR